MRLTITVSMGNEAMQKRGDAAEAVASSLLRLGYYAEFRDGDDGVIMDANGNTVGTWQADETDQSSLKAEAALGSVSDVLSMRKNGLLVSDTVAVSDIAEILNDHYGATV